MNAPPNPPPIPPGMDAPPNPEGMGLIFIERVTPPPSPPRDNNAPRYEPPRTKLTNKMDIRFGAEAMFFSGHQGGDDELSIEVKGCPQVQDRPRARVTASGSICVWNSQQRIHKDFATAIKTAIAMEKQDPQYPLYQKQGSNVYVSIKATFWVRNFSKDLDNLLKFLMDGLHDIIYQNDAFVVDAHIKKRKALKAENERTSILISTYTGSLLE